MSTSAALLARTRAAVLVVGAALGVLFAAVQAPTSGALIAAFATAALAIAVIGVSRQLSAAPAEVVRHVGARSRAHRESLTRMAEPAHPDTAGRVRSRAPGGVAAAA